MPDLEHVRAPRIYTWHAYCWSKTSRGLQAYVYLLQTPRGELIPKSNLNCTQSSPELLRTPAPQLS